MLAFKLKPIGKKNQRSFRIIVQEKREKLRGLFAEDLGWYNPHSNEMKIDKERVAYWLKSGAQPTDTTWNLFIREGLIKGKKRPVHKRPKAAEIATKPAASEPTAIPETKSEKVSASAEDKPAV